MVKKNILKNYFKYYSENININKFFNNISTNKLFIGLMMIFMNLGSRYIEIKLTKGQEMILKNIAREVLIFTIAFMGSRDIFIALIITAVFIILSNFVFNENSKFNVLPEKYKKIINVIDTNSDGKISQEEIDKAYEILKKAKNQEDLNNKNTMLNNMI
tara:strand:+ start:648 stop:1124 length:477 start_codon:yes stop_codon:yes gene_type:complete